MRNERYQITPWRTLFLINIPFVATAALLHFRHLNIPLIHRGKTMGDHLREFDTFGLVTIVGGSACREYGICNSKIARTWSSSMSG